MKNVIAIVLLATLLAAPVHAEAGPSLILTEVKVPSEIYPGDSFDISFRVKNTWYIDAREIYIYLEGGYPLLNSSPTESKSIKYLGYEYLGRISDPMSFRLTVDKSAAAGLYKVNVVLTYRRYSDAAGTLGGYERYKDTVPLLIEVSGVPKIEVFVKSSEPSDVRAGDEAEVQLKVVNTGTETARNILIFPKSIKEIEVMWFSQALYVGDLSPQGSSTTSISIDANEEIPAEEYFLPADISYQTPKGKSITASENVKITIKESADFSVSPIVNSAAAGEKEKPVSFLIKNSGSAVAEDVKIILRANYPFTPTGNEFFIGTLEQREESEAGFHVSVDSDASSQRYPVDLIVQWKEDSTEYSKTKSSFIEVFSGSGKMQLYAFGAAAVFLIIVILTRILKRNRK